MNFHSELEVLSKSVDGIDRWFKIKNDDAFVDIIDGWIAKGKDAYTKHLKGTNTVIQAGGYCGIFPRLFSQIFNTVYTFEPDPLNFFCLVANNPVSNVVKIQGALGSEHRPVTPVHRVNTNRGMHVVVPQSDSVIPTFKIDDLSRSNSLFVDLIQLDVEGYEIEILRGAEKTIDYCRPVISVEDTTQDIEKFLSFWNYKKVDEAYRDTIYAV